MREERGRDERQFRRVAERAIFVQVRSAAVNRAREKKEVRRRRRRGRLYCVREDALECSCTRREECELYITREVLLEGFIAAAARLFYRDGFVRRAEMRRLYRGEGRKKKVERRRAL